MAMDKNALTTTCTGLLQAPLRSAFAAGDVGRYLSRHIFPHHLDSSTEDEYCK